MTDETPTPEDVLRVQLAIEQLDGVEWSVTDWSFEYGPYDGATAQLELTWRGDRYE